MKLSPIPIQAFRQLDRWSDSGCGYFFHVGTRMAMRIKSTRVLP